MRRWVKRLFYCIRPGFYLMLAIMVLTVPFCWILAWILASAIHELGHYAVIKLCGKHICKIRIDWNGATMETEDLGHVQWLCALAGPVAGFLLLPFYRWIPRLAVCAFVQSCMNLLPIYPSDGGRILSGILGFWLPAQIVDRITAITSMLFIALLAGIALYGFSQYSARFLIGSCLVVLLVKLRNVRTACKDGRLLVQ